MLAYGKIRLIRRSSFSGLKLPDIHIDTTVLPEVQLHVLLICADRIEVKLV